MRRSRRRSVLFGVLIGSMLASAAGGAVVPQPARAQEQIDVSEGEWNDPAANTEWTDIGESVDQTIAGVWTDESGGEWVDPAAAPVETTPTYDANGNMIDPVTGAPLAIGPDGAPIDAAANRPVV